MSKVVFAGLPYEDVVGVDGRPISTIDDLGKKMHTFCDAIYININAYTEHFTKTDSGQT